MNSWRGQRGHEHAREYNPRMTREHNEALRERAIRKAICPDCDAKIVRVGQRMVCTRCEWGWPWQK